jgi:hypothetical protein
LLLLTIHFLPLSFHYSHFTLFPLLLPACYFSPLTSCHSLFTIHISLFTFHFSLFAIHWFSWRRERDLNPRCRFYPAHTISSRAPSASRTSLRETLYTTGNEAYSRTIGNAGVRSSGRRRAPEERSVGASEQAEVRRTGAKIPCFLVEC